MVLLVANRVFISGSPDQQQRVPPGQYVYPFADMILGSGRGGLRSGIRIWQENCRYVRSGDKTRWDLHTTFSDLGCECYGQYMGNGYR